MRKQGMKQAESASNMGQQAFMKASRKAGKCSTECGGDFKKARHEAGNKHDK